MNFGYCLPGMRCDAMMAWLGDTAYLVQKETEKLILTKVPIESQAFTFAKTLQMSNLLAGRTDDKIWEIRGASTHRSNHWKVQIKYS